LISERMRTLLLDIIYTGSGSAVCIWKTTSSRRGKRQVRCPLRLSFGDWLKNAMMGLYCYQNIEYADRYIYIDPDTGWIHLSGPSPADRPLRLYEPGLLFRLPLLLPEADRPPNNTSSGPWLTMGIMGQRGHQRQEQHHFDGIRLCNSWGEDPRAGRCSLHFSLTSEGARSRTPFPEIRRLAHLLPWKFTWPIVGTLNARKQPKIYSSSTRTIPNHTVSDFLTETSIFLTEPGDAINYNVHYSGSSVNSGAWPPSGQEAMYLKNSLTESGEGVLIRS